MKLEQEIHERFKEYRIRGEWFWPTEKLMTYIYGSPQGLPETPPKLSTAIKLQVEQILYETNNNKFKAAKRLKISRSTLYSYIKKYGIGKKKV